MSLLLACTAIDEQGSPSPQPEDGLHGEFVVSQEVAEAELNALLQSIDDPSTRGRIPRRIDKNRISLIYGNTARTLSDADAEPQPLFYVLPFEEERGYALVSTDSRTSPVYAVVDSGPYAESNDNPGFRLFMEQAEARYYAEIAQANASVISGPFDPGKSDPDKPTQWTDGAKINPLLSTKWNQTAPYNDNCFAPNGWEAYAGCGPIAVAQIACRHRYPSSFNGHKYHWTEMRKTPTISNSTNRLVVRDITHLISTIGKLMNAEYGAIGSAGTFTLNSSVIPCFRALGYTDCGTLVNYDFDLLMSSLTGLMPVFVRGATETGSGHMWVIDGYLSQYKYIPMLIIDQIVLVRTSREMVHCNWGWGGSFDGYFYSSVFDTSKRVIMNQTRSDYRYGQVMVINIFR